MALEKNSANLRKCSEKLRSFSNGSSLFLLVILIENSFSISIEESPLSLLCSFMTNKVLSSWRIMMSLVHYSLRIFVLIYHLHTCSHFSPKLVLNAFFFRIFKNCWRIQKERKKLKIWIWFWIQKEKNLFWTFLSLTFPSMCEQYLLGFVSASGWGAWLSNITKQFYTFSPEYSSEYENFIIETKQKSYQNILW